MTKTQVSRTLTTAIGLTGILVFCCRCAAFGHKNDDENKISHDIKQVKKALLDITQRMDSIETRLNTLDTKIAIGLRGPASVNKDPAQANEKAISSRVIPNRADQSGSAPNIKLSADDPLRGFVNDQAVQAFRNAMLSYNANQNTDGIVAFAEFLEKYPDHPFAGSAQYYLGMSYLKQKEYKLALSELKHVIDSYSHNMHISDALFQISKIEGILNTPEQSQNHRQLLSSLFPASPAAALADELKTANPAIQVDQTRKTAAAPMPLETQLSLDQSPLLSPQTAPMPHIDSETSKLTSDSTSGTEADFKTEEERSDDP